MGFNIGAQVSTANFTFEDAFRYIYSIGGNTVQIFLKSTRENFDVIDEEDYKKAKYFLEKNKMFLVAHGYFNLAKDYTKNLFMLELLISDFHKLSVLGGAGVILHVGKNLDLEYHVAIENVRNNIGMILERVPDDVKLILENTSGQEGDVGFKFEDLKEIYDNLSFQNRERIGFCVDTCHSHVAGYDLSTKEGFLYWKDEFERCIGWDKVVCIHLNDAKYSPGFKIDKHEDIGYGTISKEGFQEIVYFAKKNSIPMILETPEKEVSYKEQIKIVKDMAGV